MTHTRRRSFVVIGMWIDVAILLAGLLICMGLSGDPVWHKDVLVIRHPARQLALFVLLVWSWHVALTANGFYRSFRLSSWVELTAAVLRGIVAISACTATWQIAHHLVVAGQLLWTREMSFLLFLWGSFAGIFLLSSRLFSHAYSHWVRRQGRNLRHVLIVGSNQRALRVADALLADEELGYRLVGFVDDEWHSIDATERYTSALVGGLASMARLLQSHVIDEVIITLPLASKYAAIRRICQQCHEQGILVRCEVSLFTFEGISLPKSSSALQLMNLNQSAWSEWALIAKRVVDVVVATVALCVCLPLLLAIAIAIRSTSEGPILFRQERLGLGKRIFLIYKFRTMVQNAEALMTSVEHLNQSQGPTFKLSNDPRITPLGAFLRKTSLDELPQLVNVLLGDMSLVGPRPLPMRDYRGFSEDWQRRRFSVKPGITCLWQVMGRSTIGFERWMELDMSYIDSWSIWLDLKILWQTIPVVIRGSGAF
jgi:exopolysaccharide biosynthesis polyprenyl glycosylphosphotransferase